jgi:phosphoglycerol transferase MdoB-like AlkP superfamily enzyme
MQEILRWIASLSTIGAGFVLAARVRPVFMGWAFVVLSGASLIWIAVGYLASEYALMVQNCFVTLINFFGVYRWLIWKGKV